MDVNVLSSFAEDIVPIVSVLVGSNGLVTLTRHVVLTIVDVECAFHRLCLGTENACH